MVHTVRQQLTQTSRIDFPALIDPTLIRAARQIYRVYCEVNPHLAERTTGVIINQLTYRGMLTFSSKPVLLPQECLITIAQLDSGI